MLAEDNLQQKKGCKLFTYQWILLSNAKKKNKCLPAVALLCFPWTNNGKAVKVFLFHFLFCIIQQQQQHTVFCLPQKHTLFFFRRWSNQNSSAITTKIRNLSCKLKLPSCKALLGYREQLFPWCVDTKIRWTDLDEWLCSTEQMCLPIYCWHFPTFAIKHHTVSHTVFQLFGELTTDKWKQRKSSTFLSILCNLFYDYPAVCCKKHINAHSLFLTEMAIPKPLI